MKRTTLLIILLCYLTNIGIAQRRNQKTPPPDWTKKEYISSKYLESTFIYVLDSINIKRLSDSEVAEVKKNLFKTMEEELARKISTKVNVITEQTSSSQSNYSNSGNSSNARTHFREKLSITVNAKFKFKLKQTYFDKNNLWAIMVLNKEQCSLPLIIEAIDILESTTEQVLVAIDSRSSKYLLDFEEKLNLASQLQSTAVWLNSNVDLKNYRYFKNNLSGLIQQVRQLESEQKLDDAIAEVDKLVYNYEFAAAIEKARRLTYQFRDRIEITELIKRVNDQYRQHVKVQLQSEKDDLRESVSIVEDYLLFFPEDLLMTSTKLTLETKHFNTLADKAELALDGSKLNLAKQYVMELDDIKITDIERLKGIQRSLDKLEFKVLMRSLESYWNTEDYYNGWNTVKYLLSSSTQYLEIKDVQRWKCKFGKKCKKLDFREDRKTKPYVITFSLMDELRTNEGNLSDLFNDNNPYTIQQGYFAYSAAIYFRKIELPNIVLKDGRTKDKSKASLYGLKLSYLDFNSVQSLGSYDGLVPPVSLDGMGWETSFDMYYYNIWHFGMGLQHEGNSAITHDYSPDKYFTSLGLHIPFSGRRGNISILADIVIARELEGPSTFRFSTGISWNPYFIKRIGNKSVIEKKYQL